MDFDTRSGETLTQEQACGEESIPTFEKKKKKTFFFYLSAVINQGSVTKLLG